MNAQQHVIFTMLLDAHDALSRTDDALKEVCTIIESTNDTSTLAEYLGPVTQALWYGDQMKQRMFSGLSEIFEAARERLCAMPEGPSSVQDASKILEKFTATTENHPDIGTVLRAADDVIDFLPARLEFYIEVERLLIEAAEPKP